MAEVWSTASGTLRLATVLNDTDGLLAGSAVGIVRFSPARGGKVVGTEIGA